MLRLFAPRPARIERSRTLLALPDGRQVTVQWLRHPRARRMRLAVDERGARLTLPPRASERAALAFLGEHRHWLAQQLDALGPPIAPLRPWHSTELPLRGRALPVRWQRAASTRLQLDAGGESLRFDVRGEGIDGHGHAAPAVRRALRDFHEAQGRADVARWLPAYLPGLPRAPSRIVFKSTSSQWGSLSASGVMALDLALLLAPPPAFEYVLVHELCHLLHADHSPAFWREVRARCPHWRQQRQWLNRHGRGLKAHWRALVLAPDAGAALPGA